MEHFRGKIHLIEAPIPKLVGLTSFTYFFLRSTSTIRVHFQKLEQKEWPWDQRHKTLSQFQRDSLKRKPNSYFFLGHEQWPSHL